MVENEAAMTPTTKRDEIFFIGLFKFPDAEEVGNSEFIRLRRGDYAILSLESGKISQKCRPAPRITVNSSETRVAPLTKQEAAPPGVIGWSKPAFSLG